MTREDVIEILARFVIGAEPCSQREIIDACASAYGMLKEQPSLPSNLDEAADCYKDTVTPEEVDDSEHAYSYETYTEYQIADAFKAGAEWMAGQYEKIEGDPVDWYMTSEGKEYCFGIQSHDAIEVPVELYVIKKQ